MCFKQAADVRSVDCRESALGDEKGGIVSNEDRPEERDFKGRVERQRDWGSTKTNCVSSNYRRVLINPTDLIHKEPAEAGSVKEFTQGLPKQERISTTIKKTL